MTADLPEGIVTNTQSISGEIGQIEVVDVEDIGLLWRTYAANKKLLHNDTGGRLENFFWRVWGNSNLRNSLSGAHLARLFLHISEDRDILRTTPVQSPRYDRHNNYHNTPSARHSSPPPTFHTSLQSPTPPRVARSRSPPLRSQVSFKTDNGSAPALKSASAQSSEKPKSTAPPASILKKTREPVTRGDSSDSTGKKKIRLPDVSPEADASLPAPGRRLSPPSNRSRGDPSASSRRKKPPFVAGSSSSKRKPALGRRKSSQSSTTLSTAKSPTSSSFPGSNEPTTTLPEPQTEGRGLERLASVEPSCEARQENQPPQQGSRVKGLEKETEPARDLERAADRDYRARFVDQVRPGKSKARDDGPLRTKSTSTLASTLMAATGTIQYEDYSVQGDQRSQSTGQSQAQTTSAAQGKTGTPTNAGAASKLPRSKSQLTFLLGKDR